MIRPTVCAVRAMLLWKTSGDSRERFDKKKKKKKNNTSVRTLSISFSLSPSLKSGEDDVSVPSQLLGENGNYAHSIKKLHPFRSHVDFNAVQHASRENKTE